ncbi:LapA family protein [Thiomicrospira sp. R3]|uniref:LapA family protein n=1 Tax=Thiomicrospira sp. R3 TaxID=3035472 RepID=UPI00259BE7B2|nr:LapA family protein [Thiomicrospira sp. R3]WFE69815.1 LapA family protein [Thiomicrospira sp. R3]
MVGKLLSFAMLIAFIVLGVLLGSLNSVLVPFDYYFYQRHLPLSILLTVSFISGLLLAGFFIFTQVIQLKWQNRKLMKQVKVHANEVIELKKSLHKEARDLTIKPSTQSHDILPSEKQS